MKTTRNIWWISMVLPLAILLGSCGGDNSSDDGGGGTGPDTGPTTPAPVAISNDLVQNPDAPPELQGAAAMASGLSQAGNAYLGMATGNGTAAGDDCWEWAATEQGVTVLVEGCEESNGSYTWSVSFSQGGSAMCTVMEGEVSADGLSGNWTFYNCPDNPNDKLMETVWQGDQDGNSQIEMFLWDPDGSVAKTVPPEDADYYFLYQENAEGSGYAEWQEGGLLEWTMAWLFDGDTLNAEFCEYDGGVLVECTDINEGYDSGGGGSGDGPELPDGFEFDEEVLDDENVPDELVGAAGLVNGLMGIANDWLDDVEGEGTAIGDDCWEWVESDESYTVRVVACEEADGAVTWFVEAGEDSLDLCTWLEGYVAADELEGSWTFYNCEVGAIDPSMTLDWETDGADWWRAEIAIWEIMRGTLAGAYDEDPPIYLVYEENADGSGFAESYAYGVMVWSMTWQWDGDDLIGQMCTYIDGVLDECFDIEEGGGGTEPDPPEIGVPFEFRPELLDYATTPDVAVAAQLSSLAGIQEGALGWLAPPDGVDGVYEDDCWTWEAVEYGTEEVVARLVICQESGSEEACWEYWIDMDGDEELDLMVEGCAGLETLGGSLLYHFGGEMEMLWWVDSDPAPGTQHLTFQTLFNQVVYYELPDGSGRCDYTADYGSWYCTWDSTFTGEYCYKGLPEDEFDCSDF